MMHRMCWTLCFLTLGASACEPATEGKEGNLQFNYDADGSLFGPRGNILGAQALGQPLAVGARATLDVHVNDNGTLIPTSVQSANASQPSIAEVTGFQGSSVFIEGRLPGVSEIRVISSSGLSDRVDIRVDAVAQHNLEPLVQLFRSTATGGYELVDADAYLVGSTLSFALIRKSSSGQTLFDPGLASPDYTVLPEGAATVDTTHSFAPSFMLNLAGDIRITTSELSVQSEQSVEVLALDAIAEVRLTLDDAQPLEVGKTLQLPVELRDNAERNIAGVESVATLTATPDICSATFVPTLQITNTFTIEGLAPGTCTITLELGTFTESITLDVVPETSEDSP